MDIKKINNFFRFANLDKIKSLKSKILFSERQEKIFTLYYLQKKNCGFIADSLFVSVDVIYKELKIIREKIEPLL